MARTVHSKGWSPDEIKLLETEVKHATKENLPMRSVFNAVAAATGRQPNSVRNYYYTACREGDLVPTASRRAPARAFSAEETSAMYKIIAEAQAKGISVRKTTLAMANGNKTDALRLQNKYRALIRDKEPQRPRRSVPVRDLANMARDARLVEGLDADALFSNLAVLFRQASGK
ncbi:MAG: hypothetical protein FWD16_00250 [Clostridia bacterium]|nr:hypothetical protein [Clostridia bacterium]